MRFLGIKDQISTGRKNVRESTRKKKKKNTSVSLRSIEFRRLEFVEPSTKVYLLDKGYAWVQKKMDFTEDPKEEVSGNRIFRD